MNHRINFEVNGNNEIYSEWSHNIYGTGISANISSEMGEEMNFSLVLNLSKTGNSTSVNGKEYNGYEISLYENGNLIGSSYLNMDQWRIFKEKCLDSTDSFFLGNLRNSEKDMGKLNEYGEMTLKSCRFYTRPLSAKEIKLNYDTRLAYDEDDNN